MSHPKAAASWGRRDPWGLKGRKAVPVPKDLKGRRDLWGLKERRGIEEIPDQPDRRDPREHFPI